MTKKKARQTLLWMSAVLLINHIIFKNSTNGFGKESMEVILRSFFSHTISEMLPAVEIMEHKIDSKKIMDIIQVHIQEELLPVIGFCYNYWENTDSMIVEKEDVPAYFLESDEEKTEFVQEIEKQEETKDVTSFTLEQLSDYQFLIKNFYTVDSTTTVTSGELNGNELMQKDLSIQFDDNEPKILIYHTHGSEAFSDSKNNEKEETIIGVGDKLAEILEEEYHIKTYHDRSFYDMINGNLDRSKAYTYAGNGVKKILEKYPSIEVVIDLHRDAVKEGTKLITEIEGRQTAKIMFFNGLSRTAKNGDINYLKNPNKEANLAFSLQMQLEAAARYPGFTRKIYLKGYRYNLHLKPRSLLIEVGAQTNTKEEAANAMIPLAEILYQVLKK